MSSFLSPTIMSKPPDYFQLLLFLFLGKKMSHSQHANHISQEPTDDQGGEENKLEFSEDEESLIARMYNLVGDRWSLIAGRIPGRTAEEIEKYWTSKHNTEKERQS